MKKRMIVLAGTLLIQATVLASFSHAASLETQLFFFGDSLSDVGNALVTSESSPDPTVPLVPPPTRYFEGRFSNGPIWADDLVEDLGLNPLLPSEAGTGFGVGNNLSFAFGASGTGLENATPDGFLTVRGLLGQVADFGNAVGGTANPDALYVVWSGPNDYLLSMPPPPGGNPGIPFPPDPVATVGNISTAIQLLYGMGARRFLVPNLSDLGSTPIAALFGVQEQLTELTNAHNAILDATLAGLSGALSGITIYRADIFTLFQSVSADPLAFGFSGSVVDLGPAAGCLIPLPPDFLPDCSPLNLNSMGSVFWDAQHPSKELHNLVELEALRAIGAAEIELDIRPNRRSNRIRPRSRGLVPLAILSTSVIDGDPEDFDATAVDPRSVRFGLARAKPKFGSGFLRDVDRDGDPDLVLYFGVRQAGIACGMSVVSLSGRTFAGHPFVGSDTIRTVGCRPACGRHNDHESLQSFFRCWWRNNS